MVLDCPAMEPVEAHPDHLDAVLDDGVLNEIRSCRVVGLDERFGCFQPISSSALQSGIISCAV